VKQFLRLFGTFVPLSLSTWVVSGLSRLLPSSRRKEQIPFHDEEGAVKTGPAEGKKQKEVSLPADYQARRVSFGDRPFLQSYVEFALKHPDLIEKASIGTSLEEVRQTLKSYVLFRVSRAPWAHRSVQLWLSGQTSSVFQWSLAAHVGCLSPDFDLSDTVFSAFLNCLHRILAG
jgi:hypothetical protein